MSKKKSWKTSIAGWLALISAVTGGVGFLLDGNPETNPDYATIVELLRGCGITFGGIAAALIGKFARDNDVSSEDVGAK
jgi:hypothetical protein